jgi:PAS domain S-box-containing protein
MNKVSVNANKKQTSNFKKTTTLNKDERLHHLAFNHSLLPNIVSTVKSGKIIIANSAACKLLGYSKKELLTKSRAALVDINESSFKKMLKQRKTEGQAKALVTCIKKSGKRIPCEITSAIFIDKDGIEKAISTISNMSEGILKQRNIDAGKEKIVANNIVLAKAKQKNIDNRNGKIVADNIILARTKSDKERLDHEMIIKAEYKENFRLIFNSSSDVLYDFDLIANEVIISAGYEKEFGYKISNHMTPLKDWISHIHPDEKEAVQQDFLRMLASKETEWKCNYRFLKADNSVADVLSNGIILRAAGGKPYRMIGFIKDMSKQTGTNRELKQTEGYLKEYILGVGEMMFITSHKVRIPIANILGIADILNHTQQPPKELKRLLYFIKQSALSLDMFTKELTAMMSALKKIAPIKRT